LNDADLAEALMVDYRTAPVDPETKQLLSFAEQVARNAGQVTSGDIENLRAAGFSDRAILDAAHVAGFFGYMNRVVQALGADGKARAAMAEENALPDEHESRTPMAKTARLLFEQRTNTTF
jgi:uncharacterized peroxidase-related enzyme